ncbi:MAG: C13 family peptidase [Burkholderiales bacterium]
MQSAVARLAHGLRCNLVAGVRLAAFVPVGPLDYRVSPADFTVLFGFGALVAAGGSFVRGGLPGSFDFGAIPVLLADIPLVLLACVLVAAILARRELVLGLGTALVASDPLFEVVGMALMFAFDRLSPGVATALGYAFLAWGFATMLRALLVFGGRRGVRTAAAGAVLACLFAAFVLVVPRPELWVHDAPEAAVAEPSIADEQLFHRQQRLLDDAFAALAPERPGVEDLYFVGVAPYAPQDVFARELAAVRRLFDERFGTTGRSIALVNSPATLGDTPIATATNLRAALERLGRVMNPEEDVLFLFITSHGDRRHALAFELPPLQLSQVTPTALARMLGDSGIKWKVLVVSACYSGGFVEPLQDANTVVITAADAESSSFGCESGRDFTYFGRAYFDDALARTFSFTEAFEAAKRTVTEQERAERLAPSSPQIFIGNAMRRKLASLERRLAMPR